MSEYCFQKLSTSPFLYKRENGCPDLANGCRSTVTPKARLLFQGTPVVQNTSGILSTALCCNLQVASCDPFFHPASTFSPSKDGGAGGNRTRKAKKPSDFKSDVFTNFTTAPSRFTYFFFGFGFANLRAVAAIPDTTALPREVFVDFCPAFVLGLLERFAILVLRQFVYNGHQ